MWSRNTILFTNQYQSILQKPNLLTFASYICLKNPNTVLNIAQQQHIRYSSSFARNLPRSASSPKDGRLNRITFAKIKKKSENTAILFPKQSKIKPIRLSWQTSTNLAQQAAKIE